MEIKIDGNYTADDLRQIADAIDNPNILKQQWLTLEQFIERIGEK